MNNVGIDLPAARKTSQISVFLKMADIVTAMKCEMVKTTDLGWFPTDHLSKATMVLEETQRVLMYSQVKSTHQHIHKLYNKYCP